MNKPRRRVQKNWALRNELIQAGLIIPVAGVPKYLKDKGYLEAARVAGERVALGLGLHIR